MVEAPAEPRTRLHIIPYLDWVREGQETFDNQRAMLLDILAQLLEQIETSDATQKLNHFLLAGQTIVLDDIATVRESLLQALVQYNLSNKLSIGPWFIQGDGLMADGESLVRNLLLGRVDAKRHGIKLLNVAFMPDICQHTPQLPQILRGFGIDAAFMCLGQPILPLPFRWQAPDNSSILVMTYQDSPQVSESIKNQQNSQPDGPFLWMRRSDTSQSLVPELVDMGNDAQSEQSYLEAYVAELREKLPDELRPTLRGEVHLQRDTTISGRFSARINQKQELIRLQSDLIHGAEPLLALAFAYGKTRFPEIQRALLEYSWRLLLQNQSRQVIAGAISDDVYDETQIRSRRIADNTQRIIRTALDALPGKALPAAKQWTQAPTETYITVWNPHGHRVRQVVELSLQIPPDLYPTVLIAPNGEEQAFSWDVKTYAFDFLADVPSVGYTVYTLRLSKERTAAYNQKRVVAARTIGSASGESLGMTSGFLDWTYEGHTINDLVSYHDAGDAGDIWHYEEPQPDVVMRGNLVDIIKVEATPTYERLIFRNRMRIAPNLKDGKARVRGLRVLDLTTSATYYNDLQGVYFRTEFSNTAEDHLLRAHIRTGLDATGIYTDAAFGMVKRHLPSIGQASSTQAMHSLTAVYSNQRGLALFTRGLHAFEPLREDKQITIALTLLRSVGWLDKAKGIAAPRAQLNNENLVSEFMILPLEAQQQPATLIQTAQAYRAPLRAYQYDEKPSKLQHSYLQLDDERIVLTSLKPAQQGEGMIVRLLNPTRGDVGVHIKLDGKVEEAKRLNLAEETLDSCSIEKNQVNVSLEPHQVVTLHLGLGS